MRNILSKDEVDGLLEKYYPRIITSIEEGFNDYLDIIRYKSSKGELTDYSPRTIASLIHDSIRMRITREFSEAPEVITRDFNGIFGLLLEGKLLIRFKKLNEDFTTANIPTLQTKNFDNQESIEGFPKAHDLYCGYVHDGAWSSIRNIYIICREGDMTLWAKDLSNVAVEQRKLVFMTEQPQIEIPLVRAKISVGKTGAIE